MLSFGELSRPQPTAPAVVPSSQIEGMGRRRRKTKKGKKARRKTRRRYRGGVEDENPDWEALDPKHPGVKAAVALVGPKTPPPKGPLGDALTAMARKGQAVPASLKRAYGLN